MPKVISKKHGVINEVSEARFKDLIESGEYDEYKEKRTRRTKAELEAEKKEAK